MNQWNKTIAEALKEGKMRLKAAGKEPFEAEFLLEKAAGLNRTALFLCGEAYLPTEALRLYDDFLSQRESGRPVQYILGEWEFMGLSFFVGEGVLIPRQDTEVLVETIMEKQKKHSIRTILDIGTGSGCIPISLEHYGTFDSILAVDISPKALQYALKNVAKHHSAVECLESDLFSHIPLKWKGKLDAIVSNPPYIPHGEMEHLMVEVKDFEPKNALDGGEDGLEFYRQIVEQAKDWLKEDGWLFFEIGYHQGEDLRSLLQEFGYTAIEVRQDLSGLDRVVIARKRVE